MLEALAFPAINRILRANRWALETLQPHAGKTALLTSPPFEVKLTVTEAGTLTAAETEAPPDVTVALTPGVLLRLIAGDEAAWSAAELTGDVQFAAAIDYVGRNLKLDYEEALSRVIGDIAAHRVVGTARGIDRWGRSAVLNLGQALAEYALHEQPAFASAQAIDQFNSEVDDVRDHVERLDKRLELLMRKLQSDS